MGFCYYFLLLHVTFFKYRMLGHVKISMILSDLRVYGFILHGKLYNIGELGTGALEHEDGLTRKEVEVGERELMRHTSWFCVVEMEDEVLVL